MKTLLLTGFTFFDRYWHNPSGEIARRLDGAEINGYRVKSLILPVSYVKAKRMLLEHLEKEKPDAVIGLGLAPTAKSVNIELAAVNRAYFTSPDVDSYVARYVEILEGGYTIVFTTLPVERIVSKCSSTMPPVRPSLSTGLYLCNVVAYLAMNYGRKNEKLAGFLHIPPSTVNVLKGESEHGYPEDVILEAVKCVIEASLGEE